MQLLELDLTQEDLFLSSVNDFIENDVTSSLPFIGETSDPNPFWFRKLINSLAKKRLDWKPGPNRVSETFYLLIDQKEVCGWSILRFPLTSDLEASGGNVIFTVSPKWRKQGYGKLLLNKMLFESVRAGLARIKVSCLSDDRGRIKCIEANRGEFEKTKDGISYFWINFR